MHLKDNDGARLIRKFAVPRNPTKKDPRTRLHLTDDPIDGPKFVAYNQQDVRAEADISIRTPDLTDWLQEVWETDQDINQRGIAVDLEAVENCISIVEQAFDKYTAELRQITGGAVQSASQLPAMASWLRTQGCFVSSLSEDSITTMLAAMEPGYRPTRRVLEIRQILASSSVKKLYAFRHRQCQGRLHELYTVFSTRTRRWAGNGPQPQNLPSKGLLFSTVEEMELCLALIATRDLALVEAAYGDPLHAVVSVLRGLLVAAPGHRLVCSDFSAIEGVITAAISGEEWRLEVFNTHGMIYEESAARTCRIPFEEFRRHKRETGRHHPMRNKIGKYTELTCGYGGWIPAMIKFGADEFLTEEEMKKAILDWRAASPAIVEMWGGQTRRSYGNRRPERYGLEGAAIDAVEHPGKAFSVRQIAFQMHGDVLYCRLPSGSTLPYHAPRLTPSERPNAQPWELELTYEGWNNDRTKGPIGWARMKMYGGKWMENIVQAIAAEIQMHALVKARRGGYRPVLHSHDEIAGEVPLGFGSVAGLEALMDPQDLPWACMPDGRRWPIKAKGGWEGHRYGKFD